ncbi:MULTISPECIES: DUF6527 family protein [Burkholderia]|uniref:DUF6527 family protein n=1 Tax=Burkholderia TaxID=32008 RepID=UPI0009E52D37|nr:MULTISPECIES: DUF6527 family protein [Burkholderia]TGN99167.1 hypothetical protein PL79_000395 [Burkholderia sp. USMB20]
MRIDRVTPELVELAPRVLEPGRLYISEKYRAAVHLCCCGCGEKVVTPLSPAEWRIELREGRVSMRPSIGNWSMACQSHYWIRNNRVVWSGQMSKSQIRAVFERDRRDLQAMHRSAQEPRIEDRNSSLPPPVSPKQERISWRSWLKQFWHWLTR